MTGAFGLAGYYFASKPTSATSEVHVAMADKSKPWESGTSGKYQYHPGGDRTLAPRDAPSALHSVIYPNVNLPKVRLGAVVFSRLEHSLTANSTFTTSSTSTTRRSLTTTRRAVSHGTLAGFLCTINRGESRSTYTQLCPSPTRVYSLDPRKWSGSPTGSASSHLGSPNFSALDEISPRPSPCPACSKLLRRRSLPNERRFRLLLRIDMCEL